MKGTGKLIALIMLLGFIALAASVARRSSSRSKQVSFQRCMSSDRCLNNPCDDQKRELECVCYNDGVCRRAEVNFCEDCKKPEVYGIMTGMCTAQWSVEELQVCLASNQCACP